MDFILESLTKEAPYNPNFANIHFRSFKLNFVKRSHTIGELAFS